MNRRARLRRVLAMASCGLLVAGGATGCFTEPSALPTVRDFLIAWQVGKYDAAAKHTTGASRATVAAALRQVGVQLDAASMKLSLGLRDAAGRAENASITKRGDEADVRFSVKIDLGENGEPWTYPSLMRLKRADGGWKIVWDPSIVHPRLGPGQRLAVVSEPAERAKILDTSGRSLQRRVSADVIGVYPGQLKEPRTTIEQVAKAAREQAGFALDVERLLGRVESAPPQRFMPLLTLERHEQSALISRLARIPQVQRQTGTPEIGAQMAPELVGRLGPATSETLQQVGAPYQPGDTIGVTGLQLMLQRRLAGIPTVRVVAQDMAGKHVQVLATWPETDAPGNDPQEVRTTLHPTLQPRADNALAGLRGPASLIALEPSTGAVLAAANRGSGGKNLAMQGSYPPGLTFGIVSADALLHSGLTRATETECPGSVTVAGRTFTNRAQAKRSLERNFADGCGTTLVQLGSRLDGKAITDAAARYGLGKDWGLTVPAFTGTIPAPANEAEKAAMMVGEGPLRVSPLAMAVVASAAQSATWRPPFVLTNPRDAESPPAQPLDVAPTSDLQKLLRRSVASGAAKAANVGGSVSGVGAVVDYEEDGKKKTVSWFVGSRPNLAFAIAVEGRVDAARLAARFLQGTSVQTQTPTTR
ncbi:penicillin-binding transpeptidase domain-containing protein, partial [Actinomadura flavalba]|uniref:penicillin-binding transpeptidase domain-containing protein n=1 Tax=Actinomadura flavalba TaxID=1120938 RepID=UPI0005264841